MSSRSILVKSLDAVNLFPFSLKINKDVTHQILERVSCAIPAFLQYGNAVRAIGQERYLRLSAQAEAELLHCPGKGHFYQLLEGFRFRG